MLTKTQLKAVDLLFEHTDSEVAAILKVKPDVLESWMQDPEFRQAVQDRIRENRQSAVRILSRLYLNACREMDALIHSDDDKNKPKLILDLLKASGLLKECGMEDADPIAGLLARLSDDDDDADSEDSD